MPKDLWAKARAKDAAKKGRRSKTAKAWMGKRRWPKRAKPAKTLFFTVQAGTSCHVRTPDSSLKWRAHVTTLTVVGKLVWQNATHRCIRYGDYEVKYVL